MNECVDYTELMTRFRRAYAKADRGLLQEVLGAGFEWHTHTFDPTAPAPTGRVLRGLDEMLDELQRRKDEWVDVRFDGLVEHFAPRLVTQSFTISGLDGGTPFAAAAVDLYTLDDDELIVKKDTYWKYAAP
ncbi:MAG: hypothetical protein ACPHJY_09535 [Acidimicrobiales bacterium]